MHNTDLWDRVRADIVGARATIHTPFGERELTYADFTASGRAVGSIESYMARVLEHYANTHTEDDATGLITTSRLHEAEQSIKRLLGASADHRLITVGAGTTAAVHRLQQIIGIYLPPAAKEMLHRELVRQLGEDQANRIAAEARERRPVVFVGPYEHHSNEVSWRECWADVVEVELATDGSIDLDDLRAKLSDPGLDGRRKIGAFSAASNVSGVRTDVPLVASILREHGAITCFDYAAIAPYERIDAAELDAVYFSPHKYVGGPGSAGVLLIHRRIYRDDLPPTVGAGGTVNFVDFTGQDYSDDVETREKAGTPGILQTMRASLAMELQERLGYETIASREHEHLIRGLSGLDHPGIEILGPTEPERRIAIVSFNIRALPARSGAADSDAAAADLAPKGAYLHPRFVTLLLNDLFGIQSRAGCSCAGPYGHRMLGLDEITSAALRERVQKGVLGLRPGWCRVNFHYLMTNKEVDFLIQSIRFVADHGHEFLPLYSFDVCTGSWTTRRPAGSESAVYGGAGTAHSREAEHLESAVFGGAGIAHSTKAEQRGSTQSGGDSDGCEESRAPGAMRFGIDAALAVTDTAAVDAVSPSRDTSGLAGAQADEGLSSQHAVHEAYLEEAQRLLEVVRAEHPNPRLRSTLKDLIPFVYV